MATPNVYNSIELINKSSWQELTKDAGPFLRWEFLHALEQSGAIGADTGWLPAYTVVEEDGQLLAATPGFIKTHSYGEYVFDHGWANAYHQYGLNYYPKWISAIPFTPVTGPRLLHSDSLTTQQALQLLDDELASNSLTTDVSSLHWLFCPQADVSGFNQSNYLTRMSVQFQWFNRDYATMDDFYAALTSRKRRSIRKDRQRLSNKAVTFTRLTNDQIDAQSIEFMYQCYRQTYRKRSGHDGYLNHQFFKLLAESMRENLLLITASQNQQPIACALFLYDNTGLYGRYWGSLEDVDGLHFECCYLQGIEFAIEHKLPLFNPGTQGEHKILRGFEPIYCFSVHKLKRPEFHQAVADFLGQESRAIEQYYAQAQSVLPFNEEFLHQRVLNGTHNNNRVQPLKDKTENSL